MRAHFLIVACSVLAGCSDPFGVRTLTELERARRRWEAWRPETYAYAVERLCFCGSKYRGPARVHVRGDSVMARVYVDSGEPVSATFAGAFPSVEGLFEILVDAYERHAHAVRVTYDPESGVPVDFWIDYQEMAADEETGVRVTESVTGSP
jgi:hypothetical protein